MINLFPKKVFGVLEKMLEISERMRLKLLKEEFAMRKKQPTAWTKTKYRPFANFRTKKKITAAIIAE